jgi:dynein heavy chain
VLETRLRSIIDKLTLNVYEYVCLGIFEVHKLMFSFHMTIMIIEEELELNRTELDFFLKGNQSLSEVEKAKPFKWVNEQGWKDLQKLVAIGDSYKNLIEDLERNELAWRKWYDYERPELE